MAAAEQVERKSNVDKQGRAYGTGRRKNAVARVWVKKGKGKYSINGKTLEQYFARPVSRMIINQPFAALGEEGKFDVVVTVLGGGLSGQAGAVRHGISRALDEYNPEFHKDRKKTKDFHLILTYFTINKKEKANK